MGALRSYRASWGAYQFLPSSGWRGQRSTMPLHALRTSTRVSGVIQRSRRTLCSHPLANAAGRGNGAVASMERWLPYAPTSLTGVPRPRKDAAASRAHTRELRIKNMVPVVISTPGFRNDINAAVCGSKLASEVDRGAFFNRVFSIGIANLEGYGTVHNVVPVHVDFHPVRNTPRSVIFYKFDPNKPRRFDVPLELVNMGRSPGLRKGGHIMMSLETVPLMALCTEVPKSLPVDVSAMDLKASGGSAIRIKHLQWPDTVNLLLAGWPTRTLLKMVDRVK